MKKILYFLTFLIFIISLSVFAACAADNSDLPTNNGTGEIVNPNPGDSNDGETDIYTLTYSATEGGRVEGEAVQTVKSGENGKTVVAVADDGYHFYGWSDGKFAPERQEKSITKDKTVTAKFIKNRFIVFYRAEAGGTIKGSTNQSIKYGEATTEVEAVPDKGAYFVEWSDGNKNPVRQEINVNADKDLTAKFEYFKYTVTYLAGEHGSLRGEKVQTVKVNYGSYAMNVSPEPDYGYKFLCWSDGISDMFRKDKVTCDITVTAEFIGEERNIRFTAGNGGKIEGKLQQTVKYGEYCEEVVAVPDEGYAFDGWSNGEFNTHLVLRAPKGVLEVGNYDSEFIAYFRPIEKHFDYDCGNVPVTFPQEGIILKRDELLNVQFFVPVREGYIFLGWYADKDFKLKVADSDGRYMLGNYGFGLETDTLYARWTKEGESDGKIVHKVLFVMPQEIHCTLEVRDDYDDYAPAPSGDTLDVDYKMTAVEYTANGIIIQKFEERLNSWFANTNIRFEVDSYYTLLPILQENFATNKNSLNDNSVCYSFQLRAYNISEIAELTPLYHNVIVLQEMHDYYGYVHDLSLAGVAEKKYANVFLDVNFLNYYGRGLPFENALLVSEKYPSQGLIMNGLNVSIHEFTHTCEKNFGSEEILDLHKYNNGLETEHKYLLGEAEYEGRTSKILMEKYFINDYDITVRYSDLYSDKYEIKSLQIFSWGGYVKYGSDITVEVVPKEGYRFIEWSDGCTSAKRTDKNIISYLDVYPIIAERSALKISQQTTDDGESVKEIGGGYFIINYNGETIEAENIDMDFPKGAVLTVEAVPNEGYKFMAWDVNKNFIDEIHIDGSRVTVNVDHFNKFCAVFINKKLLR